VSISPAFHFALRSQSCTEVFIYNYAFHILHSLSHSTFLANTGSLQYVKYDLIWILGKAQIQGEGMAKITKREVIYSIAHWRRFACWFKGERDGSKWRFKSQASLRITKPKLFGGVSLLENVYICYKFRNGKLYMKIIKIGCSVSRDLSHLLLKYIKLT
jgi:hypothetical protein